MPLSNKAFAGSSEGPGFDPKNYRKQEKNGKNGRKERGGRKGDGRDYPDKPIWDSAANHVTRSSGLHHAWAVSSLLMVTQLPFHPCIGCLNSRGKKKVF